MNNFGETINPIGWGVNDCAVGWSVGDWIYDDAGSDLQGEFGVNLGCALIVIQFTEECVVDLLMNTVN